LSPLTKALVLLVTILSIVLVALVVPFVANTDNLQGEITSLETRVKIAKASAAKASNENQRLIAAQGSGQDQMQDRITALVGENVKLTQAVSKFEADAKEAGSKVDSLGASIVLMGSTQDNLATLLSNQTEALKLSQGSNVNLKKENAQLAQRNNDLDAQVTGLTRTNRSLTEKISDLSNQLANGPAGGSGGATVSAGLSGEVRGAVTGIETVDGNITLIQLNVGSNDQVSRNTKFILHRNDQYVGTATVKSVQETISIAKVESTTGSIRVGDGAITGISY